MEKAKPTERVAELAPEQVSERAPEWADDGGPAPGTVPGLVPGLVLAAGFSRRMGLCKLTLPWQGEALVTHAIRAARAAGLCPLLLVTRPDADPALQAVLDRESLFPGTEQVQAEKSAEGQAESLKAGIRRLLEHEKQGAPLPGCAVLLGDQPLIRPDLIRRLAQSFLQNPGRPVAPVFQGRRGHPVFLPRRAFAQVLELTGDAGARSILAAFKLLSVPVEDSSILADIDTQDAYEYLLTMKDHLS